MSINPNRIIFSLLFGGLITTATADSSLSDIFLKMALFSTAGYLMTKDADPYTGPEGSCSNNRRCCCHEQDTPPSQ